MTYNFFLNDLKYSKIVVIFKPLIRKKYKYNALLTIVISHNHHKLLNIIR